MSRIRESKIYKVFRKEASNLWTVLHENTSKKQREADSSLPGKPEVVDLDLVYPDHVSDFLESLFLRFRRNRYVQSKKVLSYTEDFSNAPETMTEDDKEYFKLK